MHPRTAEHQARKAELVQVSLYLAAWGVDRSFLVRSSMMLDLPKPCGGSCLILWAIRLKAVA